MIVNVLSSQQPPTFAPGAPPHRAGAKLDGGIFKEQQTTFVWRLVLPNLALKALLHGGGGGGGCGA